MSFLILFDEVSQEAMGTPPNAIVLIRIGKTEKYDQGMSVIEYYFCSSIN